MAWSYSGNPSGSLLDAVRFTIQDTDQRAQLLQDAEIEYALEQEASASTPSQAEVLCAAAACLEALARRFSAQADTDLGSLHIEYSRAAKGYTERAVELRSRAIGKHAPWTGGQSRSEKIAREDEVDRVQPAFRRGQFDSPYKGPPVVPGGFPGREFEP
jgi:hypothetical protein